MRVLKHMADQQEDDKYRDATLKFDEMALKSTLEFDKKHQQILGPHNKVQVCMLSGLCQK